MKKKPAFIVRDLKRSDMKDLIKNYYLIYEEVKRNPYVGITLFEKKPTMKDERKWFNKLMNEIKKGTSFASVAVADGMAVGLCQIEQSAPNIERKHLGVLGILVREGYRSEGMGTALIRETLRKARCRYKIIRLTVFETNKGAEKLYMRFGFKRYGMLPDGLVRGKKHIGEVEMYLKL